MLRRHSVLTMKSAYQDQLSITEQTNQDRIGVLGEELAEPRVEVLPSEHQALCCPEPVIRWQYSARVSRMSSADLVQANGLGSLFHSLIHLRMSASSSVTLRWADLRSLRLVSSANQRSARLSQLELVGVKCRWKRGCFSSHWWIAGVLCVA